MYIKLDVGFYTHRKTVRLFRLIGDAAYWVPPRLFTFAATAQADGDFSDYTAEDVAEAINYRGNAKEMWEAMKKVGFIDPDGKIHNWKLHGAYHEEYRERARKAAFARWNNKNKDAPSIAISTTPSIPLGIPYSNPVSIAPSTSNTGITPPVLVEGEEKKDKKEKKERASIAPSIASSIEPENPAPAPPTEPRRSIPENLAQVLTYAEMRNWPKDEAEKFWNHFESMGWIDKNGNPVRSWQNKLAVWITEARSAANKPQANGHPPLAINPPRETQADRDVKKLEAIRAQQLAAMKKNAP